ncbi:MULTISPECIES: ATP-binding cassette domain-containing protein [unclassified Streptomyces]|uniref:ATP-binding cassette domain-containing protein n=1 Tax=unclassified Streptomyces TaxID=2593676 RepID=UPI0037B88E34
MMARFRHWSVHRTTAARQLQYLTRQAGGFNVGCALAVHLVAGLVPIVFVLASSAAIQDVYNGSPSSAALWLGATVAACLVQQVVSPLQILLSHRIQLRVDAYCSRRLFADALGVEALRDLEAPLLADALADATESLNNESHTPGGAVEGALALVPRYVQLVGAVVIVGVLGDLWSALLALAIALMNRLGQTIAFSAWSAEYRAMGGDRRRVAYLRDMASDPRMSRDIRVHRIRPWLQGRYREDAQAYLARLWRTRHRMFGRSFAVYALVTTVAGTGLVVMAVVAPVLSHTLSVGSVAMLIQAIMICMAFGVIFPESDTKMQYGRNTWQAILEVERGVEGAGRARPRQPARPAEPRSAEPRLPEPRPLRPRPRSAAPVAVRGLCYRYDSDTPVIRGIDLQLRAGTSTAIVGSNGAGKSTLVKLLTGLYLPDEGEVRVDGRPLDESTVDAWQAGSAVLFQDFLRYRLTVRENVAMQSVAHLDDTAGILDALARVGLATVIDELPQGVETPLSRLAADGAELSGGQWQRLALARVLFAVAHGARFLVLDEPTAQLDARGEAQFYNDFLELTRGVTSLVISHRLSSVRRADAIGVLAGGRITEFGTHRELVRTGGTYQSLFALQSQRYVER